MRLRSYFYDALSLLLLTGSLFFFYQSTQFLLVKDYIAAGMTLIIGVCIIRIGVQLSKLALFAKRQARDLEKQS